VIELIRAGRTPEQLAKEFEPSAQAKNHVSRFIVGLVRESLDLKAIMAAM
jgi:hypothetical protein